MNALPQSVVQDFTLEQILLATNCGFTLAIVIFLGIIALFKT